MKEIQKLNRLITIIKFIEDPSDYKSRTLKDIQNAVNNILQITSDKDKDGVSERTIKRDINDIKNGLGIEIEFNSKTKNYFIKEKVFDEILQYLEAANIVYIMQNMHNIKKFIAFDKSKERN